MQTFIKLFLVVFAIILFAGISQQRELIAVWMGQASKALGMQDEIYQWNTDIAWEKTDREHELLETGNWVQREFLFLDYSMRARVNSDGSVLAAVYFYDNCLVGTSIMTDVLDINDEPFEMRCTETPDFTGWRVGARFPNAAAGWYENYGDFKVRAKFCPVGFRHHQKVFIGARNTAGSDHAITLSYASTRALQIVTP